MRSNSIQVCCKLALITSFIGIVWYFQQQVPDLIQTISSWGYVSILGFGALYCLTALLCLPVMPIILAAGAIYGFYWGFVINLFSATLSASLAFLVSRHMGIDWIPGIDQQRIAAWSSRVESLGWKSLALCLLTPFIPCAIVNYGYGFTRIKLLTYILTSFIFFIPYKFVVTYLGNLGGHWATSL